MQSEGGELLTTLHRPEKTRCWQQKPAPHAGDLKMTEGISAGSGHAATLQAQATPRTSRRGSAGRPSGLFQSGALLDPEKQPSSRARQKLSHRGRGKTEPVAEPPEKWSARISRPEILRKSLVIPAGWHHARQARKKSHAALAVASNRQDSQPFPLQHPPRIAPRSRTSMERSSGDGPEPASGGSGASQRV